MQCDESVISALSSLSESLLELVFYGGNLADEICESIGEGLLRTIVGCRLHTEDKLVLQRVWHLVASKQYLGVTQQLAMGSRGLNFVNTCNSFCTEHIALSHHHGPFQSNLIPTPHPAHSQIVSILLQSDTDSDLCWSWFRNCNYFQYFSLSNWAPVKPFSFMFMIKAHSRSFALSHDESNRLGGAWERGQLQLMKQLKVGMTQDHAFLPCCLAAETQLQTSVHGVSITSTFLSKRNIVISTPNFGHFWMVM